MRREAACSLVVAVAFSLLGCTDEGPQPDDDSAGSGGTAYAPYDFDGDGRADQALFVDADGGLLVHRSVDGTLWDLGAELGVQDDRDRRAVAADYDGDGRADPAWLEPATGLWRVFDSDSGYAERPAAGPMGEAGDLPIAADLDGDGLADMAVYRSGTGRLARWDESAGALLDFEAEGAAVGAKEWLPAVADFDGDGIADYAWFVPSTGAWRVHESSNGHAERDRVEFGSPLAVPVPADFDGDGRADLAVFERRTGELWVLRSSDGETWTLEGDSGPIGSPHFLPAVADYDGDGMADASWFVPSTTMWRVYDSSSDFAERDRVQIGAADDVPVQTPLVLAKRGTTVVEIGAEEPVGTTTSVRGVSVDVDSLNRPHVLGERQGSGIDAYHRIDGAWLATEPLINPAGALGSPHIEIDADDRAWISYTTFISNDAVNSGEWVALVEDVATAPSLAWEVMVPPYTGFSGYLAIDPYYPDYAWRMGGQPAPTYRYDDQGTCTADITLSPGISSETIGFEISPVKRGAEPGVWHAAHSVIYQAVRSGYVNSTLDAAVIWDDHLDVISVDSDQTRAYMGIDRRDPEVAYINTYHDGLVVNIWDGDGLVFPSDDVYLLDPAPAYFGNGAERFGAQWTHAAREGAFLCWTGSDGWIRLKHFDYRGEAYFGETLDVCPGQQCTLATDHRGNLHMAYVNGGTVHYRWIRTR